MHGEGCRAICSTNWAVELKNLDFGVHIDQTKPLNITFLDSFTLLLDKRRSIKIKNQPICCFGQE
jgi:hypothetical protein